MMALRLEKAPGKSAKVARDADSHNRGRNKRKPHTPLEHRIISKLNRRNIDADEGSGRNTDWFF
jgi:hypothetical protein